MFSFNPIIQCIIIWTCHQYKKKIASEILLISFSLCLFFFFFFTTVHILMCISVQTRSISGALQSDVALILDRASLDRASFFSFSHPIANREHHNTAINSKRLSLKTPKLNSWWSQWQFTFLLTSSKGLSDKWSHQILITTHDMNKEDVISSYYTWEN